MFATARTPTKKSNVDDTEKAVPPLSKVRTSIGEWETGRVSPVLTTEALTKEPAPPKTKTNTATVPIRRTSAGDITSPPPQTNYGGNRIAEARASLNKAKMHINSSRNMRTDIKEGIIVAVDRLFQLVKEAETEKKAKTVGKSLETNTLKESTSSHSLPTQPTFPHGDLLNILEQHNQLIKESCQKMNELQKSLDTHQITVERATYASVAAGAAAAQPARQPSLHSVMVTSDDSAASGEEVIEKIKKAINAREGGIIIDKIRKAKDRKVIIGCRNENEIRKVTERIKERGDRLQVEEMKNKDPLIVLYNVLQSNTNEDIVEAIRGQNKHLLKEIKDEECRIDIRFRKKARNPLTAHVVARVSPQVWRRLTDAGAIQVDIQRVRVADQSPLIQCSRCLGYGHGRRFCHDVADVCSHCGGQHTKAQCPEWLADTSASCVNCVRSKQQKADHNAFSSECPVRRKWEILARSAIAYC